MFIIILVAVTHLIFNSNPHSVWTLPHENLKDFSISVEKLVEYSKLLKSTNSMARSLSIKSRANSYNDYMSNFKNFLALESPAKSLQESLTENSAKYYLSHTIFDPIPKEIFSLWHPYFVLLAAISTMDKSNTMLEMNKKLENLLRISSNENKDLSKMILSSNNWNSIDTKRNIIVSYKDFDYHKMGLKILDRTRLFQTLWQAFNFDFPMNSNYLRNLGMEIIEVPNNFSVIEFKDMLSTQGWIIEKIFEDNELSEEINDQFKSSDIIAEESLSYTNKDLFDGKLYMKDMKSDSDDSVIYRHLKSVTVPNDSGFTNQWAFIDSGDAKWGIEMQTAWQYWTGKDLPKKFTIALIDSGVDYNHPDLKNSLWKNEEEDCTNGFDDDGNGYIDDCYGWDFVNNDNNPLDDNGHGTASAGIVAAQTNNNLGVAGMCWGCEIMVLKALNNRIKGSVSGFIKAIDYALEKGVTLSSNSYGGRGGDFDGLKEAVIRAQEQGMIFVAAAGNYQGNNDNDKNPVYPASYNLDNVISVAAVTRSGRLADYSSYGRNSVDIAAPGEKIFSTHLGSGYMYVDGTSFAVPFVTGAIALLWSSNPRLSYLEVIDKVLENQKPCPHLKGLTRTSGVLDIARIFKNEFSQNIVTLETDEYGSCRDHNPCDFNAICQDTRSGPKCYCKNGLSGDGIKCFDINECDFTPCGAVSTCINHFSYFECICNIGFHRVGDTCQDVNECEDESSCPDEAVCYNFAGTYDCVCPPGHFWSLSLSNYGKCVPHSISDQCSHLGGCGINSICKTKKHFWYSSYNCECLKGYFKDEETGECIREGIMNFQKQEYIQAHPMRKSFPPEGSSQNTGRVDNSINSICLFGICF